MILLCECVVEVCFEMLDGCDLKIVVDGKGEVVCFIDVGWVMFGDFFFEFEMVVWVFVEGEVFEFVEGGGGFYVFKVVVIEEFFVKFFEEVVDQICVEEQGCCFDDEIGVYLIEFEEKFFFVVNLFERVQGFKMMLGRVVENGVSCEFQLLLKSDFC